MNANQDELKSQIPYGTFLFPFAHFIDERKQYQDGMMGWHWHEELEFIRVLSGSVHCQAGGSGAEILAGDGMFINHDILHCFQMNANSKMMVLVFSPRLFSAPYMSIFTDFVKPVLESNVYAKPLSQKIEWEQDALMTLQNISQIVEENPPTRELDIYIAVLKLWRNFFLHVFDNGLPSGDSGFWRNQQRMKRMLDFIEQNFSQKIALEDIASAAYISKSEAIRCFSVLLHTSPVKYLNEYRLSQAMKLLCTTDMPITAVAENVGFGSNTYFTRLFHRQFQATPAEMRKSAEKQIWN